MVKRFFMFFIIVSCFTVSAEEAAEQKSVLSYDTYIAQISGVLPEIKSSEISLLSAENSVKSADSAGNISLNSGGSYSSATQYSSSSSNIKSKNTSASVGLSKKIISTGTTVSGDVSYTKNEYISPLTSTSYSSAFTIGITQPLLNNFLGKVDSFAQNDAQAQYEIEKILVSENNKSIINAYKKLYFQWEHYRRTITNIEDSVAQARTLNARVEQNYKAGLTEDYVYLQTLSSLLSYRSDLKNSQSDLSSLEKQLSVYYDVSHSVPSSDDFESVLKKALESEMPSVEFSKTESAKIINLSLTRYVAAESVYANKLLPTFNVTGELTRKDSTDSATTSSRLPDTDYSIGFAFSYPLGNDAAEADLQSVKIKLQDLKYEYDSSYKNYQKSLLYIQESAANTKEILRTKEEIARVLSRQFESQRKKYTQGRLGISEVITTANSITSVRNEILNLKYTLISNYIDYCDLVQ